MDLFIGELVLPIWLLLAVWAVWGLSLVMAWRGGRAATEADRRELRAAFAAFCADMAAGDQEDVADCVVISDAWLEES